LDRPKERVSEYLIAGDAEFPFVIQLDGCLLLVTCLAQDLITDKGVAEKRDTRRKRATAQRGRRRAQKVGTRRDPKPRPKTWEEQDPIVRAMIGGAEVLDQLCGASGDFRKASPPAGSPKRPSAEPDAALSSTAASGGVGRE